MFYLELHLNIRSSTNSMEYITCNGNRNIDSDDSSRTDRLIAYDCVVGLETWVPLPRAHLSLYNGTIMIVIII